MITKLSKTYIALFVCITTVQGCDNTEVNNTIKANSINPKQAFTKEGFWVLSQYFDSIKEHKSIATYRVQQPVWSSFALNITKDSVFSYGSIIDTKNNYKGNTFLLTSPTSGIWVGHFDSIHYQIKFKSIDSAKKHYDTNTYHFTKRPDLAFLLNSIGDNRFTALYKNVSQYLTNKLFTDTFLFHKQEVIFNKGNVTGFESFDSFTVGAFFGTYHPIFNDYITFYGKQNESTISADYNWEFKHDTLWLTPLIFPEYTYNGKTVKDYETHTVDSKNSFYFIKKAETN